MEYINETRAQMEWKCTCEHRVSAVRFGEMAQEAIRQGEIADSALCALYAARYAHIVLNMRETYPLSGCPY